jgi:SAM-dependent methyltransferase
VIGVDMTPDMIAKARANAAKGGFTNVEFREGEIEHLPVEDHSVDLVISNCVINLSPNKPQVFREIHRVLKPGGRMLVSDIVLLGPLPDEVLQNVQAYAACIAGAAQRQDYLAAIAAAGLKEVTVVKETQACRDQHSTDPFTRAVADYLYEPDGTPRIASISVRATK